LLRLPLLVLVALVIAFGGGVWSARLALEASSGFGALELGPWAAFPELQSPGADPYAKAHRAKNGLLLLGRAEGLIFTASADSEGAALSARCAYRLEGGTPLARFWTLRIVDGSGSPFSSEPGFPRSLSSWQALRLPDGAISVALTRAPHSGNWLRLSGDGTFRLVFTLVDTPTAGSAGLAVIDMPVIRRGACLDA